MLVGGQPAFGTVLSSVYLTSPVLLLLSSLSCTLAVSRAPTGRWCIKEEAAVEVDALDPVVPMWDP